MQTKERKESNEIKDMPRKDRARSELQGAEHNGQMPDRMTRSRAIIEGVTPEWMLGASLSSGSWVIRLK
jgi:hypothetical protein